MAVLESETKPIRLDLPAAAHRELRMLAAENETSMIRQATQIIVEHLAKRRPERRAR